MKSARFHEICWISWNPPNFMNMSFWVITKYRSFFRKTNKDARGFVRYKGEKGTSNVHLYSSDLHLNLVPQEILVTAPELQEDWMVQKLSAWVYIYNLSLHWCHKRSWSQHQNYERGERYFYKISWLADIPPLGAMRDVTAPELQEVSPYQFIWTSKS